jgi:hypothetical protein
VALKEWWLLGLCSSFFLCFVFGSAYCLLLYSASPSLSLLIPALSFPVSAVFICRKKNGAKTHFWSFFCCPSPVLSSLFFLGQQRQRIYSLYTTLVRKDLMH